MLILENGFHVFQRETVTINEYWRLSSQFFLLDALLTDSGSKACICR